MGKFKIEYVLEAETLNDAMNVAHLLLLRDETAEISDVSVRPVGSEKRRNHPSNPEWIQEVPLWEA